MTVRAAEVYDALVLRNPRLVLLVMLAVLVFFGYHTKDFRLDASADSLLLEDDADLSPHRHGQMARPVAHLIDFAFALGDRRPGLRHARHCAQHRPRRRAGTRDAAAPAGGRTEANPWRPHFSSPSPTMATAVLSQRARRARRIIGVERPLASPADGGALGGILRRASGLRRPPPSARTALSRAP